MKRTNLGARKGLAILGLIIAFSLQSCSSDNKEVTEPDDDVCTFMNDINFMKFCYDNYDVNKDGVVSTTEAMAVTEMEIIATNNIKSLQGIQYFKNLTALNVTGQVANLNLSENIQITSLALNNSALTSLDLSKNTKITSLVLENTIISSLDLSYFTELEYLHLSGDKLTSIDTSPNKELKHLHLSGSALTSLNIEENVKLNTLLLENNTIITTLDVSKNLQLNSLDITSSAIETLLLSPDQKIETLETAPQTDITTVGSTEEEEDKMGVIKVKLSLEQSINTTRALTVIPSTSWEDINQVQLFLYDETGTVKFSAIEKPTSNSFTFAYTNIPVGSYTLVAVANAQSDTDNITTQTANGIQNWTVDNVYDNAITDLLIKHKAGSWSTTITGTANANSQVSGLTPYTEPSEIFMGSVSNVQITTSATSDATIYLKREVAMMRVRIDQTTYNEAKNVDFTNVGAAVMLYNLPDQISIQAGNTGGVSANSTANNVISATGAFSTTASGYLDGKYTSWKEVVVFPNNGGRINDNNASTEASKKYFIVICGIAKAGHYYAGSNTATTVDAPVFWSGPIDMAFAPSTIREVSVILKTGGKPVPPTQIIEYGDLDIIVSAPILWGSDTISTPPIDL